MQVQLPAWAFHCQDSTLSSPLEIQSTETTPSGFQSFRVTQCSGLSLVWLFGTSWTAAHQALLSMGLSRQEYWRGLPCPPPGALPQPGIKPTSPASPALAGGFFTTEPPRKPQGTTSICKSSLVTYIGQINRFESGIHFPIENVFQQYLNLNQQNFILITKTEITATMRLLAASICTIFTKCQVTWVMCSAKASPISYAFYILHSFQSNSLVWANTGSDNGSVTGKISSTRPSDCSSLHSSVLAWRIPGTGEPGGLPSMGSHRVGHDWSNLAAAAAASPPHHSVLNYGSSSTSHAWAFQPVWEAAKQWLRTSELDSDIYLNFSPHLEGCLGPLAALSSSFVK